MTTIEPASKSMVGALIAYLGPDLQSVDFEAAARVAPWRGQLRDVIKIPELGLLCAQGAAITQFRHHLAIGFHGRIDNLDEIATLLNSNSHDPLDLIAQLYLDRGNEFGQHILGDFAIVVIDPHRRSLLAVRDWIGVRPLFWLVHGDGVAVASEIKQALALFSLPTRPAQDVLDAYTANETLAHTTTFISGVEAVPACGQVLIQPNRSSRAWRRNLLFPPVQIEPIEAATEIRRRLEIALTRRLAGGARAASLLSGGVDSPAVTAVAASLSHRGVVQPLAHCYTQALPEVPECDETEAARRVAKACAIPWSPVELRLADFRAWPARASILHDGPVFLTSCGARFMLEAARRDGIQLVLTGFGGDEFADQSCQELRQTLLRREWSSALQWMISGGLRNVRTTLGTTARALRDGLIKGQRAEARFEATAASFGTRFALEILEREGAYHGIAVAHPLLDYELASFLAGLPPSIKSTPSINKSALREAVKGLVPDAIRINPAVVVYNAVALAAFGACPEGLTLHQLLNSRCATAWQNQLEQSS